MKSRIQIYSEEKHQAIMEELFDKAQSNKALSAMETEIFCTRLTRESRATFSTCDEYRFRDYYFASFSNRPIPEQYRLSDSQKYELNRFADDWHEKVVLVQNHKSAVNSYYAMPQNHSLRHRIII